MNSEANTGRIREDDGDDYQKLISYHHPLNKHITVHQLLLLLLPRISCVYAFMFHGDKAICYNTLIMNGRDGRWLAGWLAGWAGPFFIRTPATNAIESEICAGEELNADIHWLRITPRPSEYKLIRAGFSALVWVQFV